MRIVVAVLFVVGCSQSQPVSPDMAPAGVLPELPCSDSIDSIYADPGPLPAERGTIIKCAREPDRSATQLTQEIDERFTASPLSSAAHVYRVLYRTERGGPSAAPATSSALVMLPERPRGSKLPAVVVSHGSRGQGPKCAPSRNDPEASNIAPDFPILVNPFVGYGYAIIAPDLAGYANYDGPGTLPPTYGSADDAAKSTLDGARALRQLIPGSLSDQTVLVGFSQGGHTTLSALALAEAYAPEIKLAAVSLFAPLWLGQRSWGALIGAPDFFPVATNPGPNAVSVYYHYTHGELLDGAGHGLDLFRAEKRAGIKTVVDTMCWGQDDWALLKTLGNLSTDYFDPDFAAAIGGRAAGFETSCPAAEPAKSTCEKWFARYTADRPHLTGGATQVPMALIWGAKDQTIPYDRITCAIDRLKGDSVALNPICVVPEMGHGAALGARVDWMADWIAARTLGGAEPNPSACGGDESTIVDNMGAAAHCNQLPPNDP